VDAAEVVKEVVAGFEAEPIQRRDVASDPVHLDARFGCPRRALANALSTESNAVTRQPSLAR
jgi:hypothetical protein